MKQTANLQKNQPTNLPKKLKICMHPTAPKGLDTIALPKKLKICMHPTAPKGLNMTAQGNALGMDATDFSSPEGAKEKNVLTPLQGLPDDFITNQGRRFALPLAIVSSPFEAFFCKLTLLFLCSVILPILAHAQLPNYGDLSIKVEHLHSYNVGEGYGEYRATITNHSSTQSHKVTVLLNNYTYDQPGIREVRRTVELAPLATANMSLFSPSFSAYGGAADIAIDGVKQKERVTITEEKIGNISPGEGPGLLLSQQIFKSGLMNSVNVEQSFKTSSGQWRIATQSPDIPVSEWSQNWMSYARFDGIVLQADELNAAPETVRLALLRHIERGGTLIVAGNWQPPAQWQPRSGIIKDEPVDEDEAEVKTEGKAEPTPTPVPKYVSRSDLPIFYIGFGAVVVTGSIDPKEITVNQWKRLSQSLSNSAADQTESNNLADINRTFQIVEKFGVPIRGLFVLMLLFVIVIGPVNLLWLAKRKRKIWMLWTIPAISLLTCLFVAGFSLFGEGWNAVARTEALTILDETAHRATTIGWTAFYSPITPSEGLHFSYDTELIPQLPQGWDYRRRVPERTIDWTNDQHLDTGWVAARVPAFFKLQKNEARRERLNIRQAGSGATLVNGLGAEIAQVWWADADGKIYSAENVAAGAQASLKATGSKASTTPSKLRLAYSGDWLKEFKAYTDKPQEALMPNSYLAVLNSAPFVEEGLKNVKTRNARNLIYGVGGER